MNGDMGFVSFLPAAVMTYMDATPPTSMPAVQDNTGIEQETTGLATSSLEPQWLQWAKANPMAVSLGALAVIAGVTYAWKKF